MRVLVTGGAGLHRLAHRRRLVADGHEPVVLDALLPSAHAVPPPDLRRTRDWIHADVRDRGGGRRARCAASTRSATRRRWSASAWTSPTPRTTWRCNDLGTAVLLAAMAAAGVRRLVLAGSMVVYGEGRYDCAAARRRRARARAPRPTWTAGRFEPPLPALRRGRWRPAWSARTRPPTRATSTPRPSSPRSTWPPPGRARPAAGRSRCATTTSTGRGCRATPRTRASPRFFRSALARGEAPAGLRGRRPAARLRPRRRRRRAPTSLALAAPSDRAPGPCARTTSAAAPRTPSARWPTALAAGARRPRAGGHRRVPARRRPAHHRLLRAAAHRAGLARRRSDSPRAWREFATRPSARRRLRGPDARARRP